MNDSDDARAALTELSAVTHIGKLAAPLDDALAVYRTGEHEKALKKLAAARGRIDLAISDHADYSNGWAWVSPTARPPSAPFMPGLPPQRAKAATS